MRISEVLFYPSANISFIVPDNIHDYRRSRDNQTKFSDPPRQVSFSINPEAKPARTLELWRARYDTGKDVLWLTDGAGDVQFQVTGILKNFNSSNPVYIIDELAGGSSRKVKATDFYRYLILKHGFTLISGYAQSPGGVSVWQSLNQDPEISVYTMRPISSYKDKPKEETPIVDLPKNIQLALNNLRPSKYKLVTLTKAPAKSFMRRDNHYERLVATKKGTVEGDAQPTTPPDSHDGRRRISRV